MRAMVRYPYICQSCSVRLSLLFARRTASIIRSLDHRDKIWSQGRGSKRNFNTGRPFKASVEHGGVQDPEIHRTTGQIEAIVRQARQTFGETLPQDFLSSEEYAIYERLYGPPSAVTLPEDVDLLRGVEEEEDDLPENILMRENADGELEEVAYDDGEAEESGRASDLQNGEISAASANFDERVATLKDTAAARLAQSGSSEDRDLASQEDVIEMIQEEAGMDEDGLEEDEGLEQYDENSDFMAGDSLRTHRTTAAGRFGTSPSTLHLPKVNFVDPITALLSDASNKQMAEISLKTFGGPGLPNSTATITRPNLRQQPIALEASQYKMGEMEGNAFLAAIMPGAYATVMSTLVEVRKRLGADWLRNLIEKPGGPRILDAGSGGAGVMAWREVLRTEWQLMHSGDATKDKSVSLGKSTVVTGSAALRNRASHLLEDTTFIPRLPDYDPSRDHPSLEHSNPQPRKQYDIILAPHTLWTLKEDHMRKSQVQNFWSLLDPQGGVLVFIEKGVPRGFELIAGARETLLKHHISSPGAEQVEYTIEDANENRFGPKEKGMIIAPCTNHGKCPMYIKAGTSQGRKDFCHFSQRYIRPPYLQRILGNRDRNHEDISFSYVALQRGVDRREVDDIKQGQPATEAAFAGYEDALSEDDSAIDQKQQLSDNVSEVSTLSLPRAILPPIKRRGHVVLDLCTPAGKIERWTVPKSFSKQAYRDARKSKWGDLWALGAKTRVSRNIRVGLHKTKTRSKDISKADEEGMDGIHDSHMPGYTGVKTTKKSRQSRQKRQLIEENY